MKRKKGKSAAKPNFLLVDKANGLYCCEYCDTMYKAGEDGTVVEKA